MNIRNQRFDTEVRTIQENHLHFHLSTVALMNTKSKYKMLFRFHNASRLTIPPMILNTRGDFERPCFDQLHAHILERLLFCWRSKMSACSWSKHGRLQSPLVKREKILIPLCFRYVMCNLILIRGSVSLWRLPKN